MSSFASLAETRIQEALEAGEHLHLSGMGQPIDMEAYFSAPSSMRAGFAFLKNAQVIPPEVEAMRQVALLRDRLAATRDPHQAEALRHELQAREVELALGIERIKMAIKADVVG